MEMPGDPGVLELKEVAEPSIRLPHQVKVRVEAAGVNPVDTKVRARGVFLPDGLPAVLGLDGAGVVVETGPKVTTWQVGDPVWFCHGGLGGPEGSYAELAVLDETALRRKPATLTFAEAAAAPLVLITAWEALHQRAHLQPGQSVLVHAGAGGVGHVAIQLAKLAGARVATTVSSAEKAEFVRGLGADEVIRYDQEDFVDAVLAWTEGRGVDVALDTVGGVTFRRTCAAVAYGGDLVTLLDPGVDVAWKEARSRNLRIGFELMLTPLLDPEMGAARAQQGEILDRCAALIDHGRLRVEVARTFALAEAADAHRLVEEGHLQGKVVLTCGSAALRKHS